MRKLLLAVVLLAACSAGPATPPPASGAPTDPQVEAREILGEMVSLNTTLDSGSVTPLAEKIAARFRAAGVPDSDLHLIGSDARSHNLVIRLHGTGSAKPVLFMGHLDVVPAPRADWSVDPFKVTEKDGWFYGRGVLDDKGPVTTLVAGALALIRSGVKPSRDLIFAFCANEESGDDGAEWLVGKHRELVDAEWVFNFDAGGPEMAPDSAVRLMALQGAEKVYWTIALAVKNKGGHSSQPRADNAIYQLADALERLRAYHFPIHLTDVARQGLAARAPFLPGGEAALIRAALVMPVNNAAVEKLAAFSPAYNALTHTTCIATMLAAGHAENALPAEAKATVNCRLIPGEQADETMNTLKKIIADTAVVISVVSEAKPSPPSPLLPERLALVSQAMQEAWGKAAPIVPIQESGATDGLFFRNVGIPVYGLHGIPMPDGDDRMHGNDERIPGKSFADGVKFATALIKRVAK